MNSRERVVKTLNFEQADRVPRDLWYQPGVKMFRTNELEQFLEKYLLDFKEPDYKYGRLACERGTVGEVGEWVDEWGCIWNVGEPGVKGEVKEAPLADCSLVKSYNFPWNMLNQADFSKTNISCQTTDKFVKIQTRVRTFERMQFLRGTQNLLIDLGYKTKDVYYLRDMVHDFFKEEIKLWAKTDVDGIGFMDDWGSQRSLLISPDLWKSFYKPLYKEYCDICHTAGKYVFFHSDGYIEPIIPDLIELGIDALNSQLFCMNIEEIGAKYAGKITFWGEIDRQHILPFGTEGDVRNAVRRVRSALDENKGGVIAMCSWGVKDPRENIETVYDEWLKPRELTERI